MITLVAIRQLEIDGHVIAHGCEVPPDFPKETIDKLIDQKRIREYDSKDRRSLFRLFAPFSDCEEREQLSETELTELCLPE